VLIVLINVVLLSGNLSEQLGETVPIQTDAEWKFPKTGIRVIQSWSELLAPLVNLIKDG